LTNIEKGRGEMAKAIIYTKTGCPYCAAAREDLKSRGIEFEEINVAQNPEQLNEMIKISGSRKVPVIITDGKTTVGFNGY